MQNKIITPSQFAVKKLELKIIVDPVTGQAELKGANQFNPFAICMILNALIAGLLQELQKQASMLIGSSQSPETTKGMVEKYGKENNDENRGNNGSGPNPESGG